MKLSLGQDHPLLQRVPDTIKYLTIRARYLVLRPMDEGTVADILGQNSWFAGLPPALSRDIVRQGEVRRVRDTVLFAAGDEPNGLFGVLAGQVHVSYTTSEGQLGLLLVAGPGEWIGEAAVLNGGPRFLDAYAAGHCDLLHLSMNAFRRLTNNFLYYQAFVILLCDHYQLALRYIKSSRELPTLMRLAQRLLFFSRSRNESGKPSDIVPLSQEQLASAVGISRQALNSHLKSLERERVIFLDYRAIRILKRTVLEQMIQPSG